MIHSQLNFTFYRTFTNFFVQFQNDTDNIDNKNTSSVGISSHPQVNLFATVYGLTVLVTMLVHLIRGYIYVKVSEA